MPESGRNPLYKIFKLLFLFLVSVVVFKTQEQITLYDPSFENIIGLVIILIYLWIVLRQGIDSL